MRRLLPNQRLWSLPTSRLEPPNGCAGEDVILVHGQRWLSSGSTTCRRRANLLIRGPGGPIRVTCRQISAGRKMRAETTGHRGPVEDRQWAIAFAIMSLVQRTPLGTTNFARTSAALQRRISRAARIRVTGAFGCRPACATVSALGSWWPSRGDSGALGQKFSPSGHWRSASLASLCTFISCRTGDNTNSSA